MDSAEPLRIFISYSRKDGAALARRLESDLAKEGFDTWLDTLRIEGGRVWSGEIESAIKSSQVMIAVMSPGAYGSEICRAEQLLALDLGVRLIPVLAVALRGSDRPLYLYARQFRDFTDDARYAERLGELLYQVSRINSHDLAGSAGGIGERSEQVENRAQAQLAPRRLHVFHR